MKTARLISSYYYYFSLIIVPCFVRSFQFKLYKHLPSAFYSISTKRVGLTMSRKRKQENDSDEVKVQNDVISKPKANNTIITERTVLQAQNTDGEKYCRIISWNVAGLRGILKNNPNIFKNLVEVKALI
jgi:hypothetical protein